MASSEDVGFIQQMLEAAREFDITNESHSPTCWKRHAHCALARVVGLLTGEEEEGEP